jgi:hypothetical protein
MDGSSWELADITTYVWMKKRRCRKEKDTKSINIAK